MPKEARERADSAAGSPAVAGVAGGGEGAAPGGPGTPGGAQDVERAAGRGGLAVAFAKVYFIVQGLAQQIALPRVLGLDGYGAWSTVNSIASVTYNPVIAMSIQGVSRTVAKAGPEEQGFALRQTLAVHAVIAVLMGGGFFFLSPSITAGAGAPHVTEALRILSGAMLLYAVYAPLIGALNGQRRFLHQAGFDILAATLRTIGLVGGAWYFARHGFAVEGAAAGFVVGLVLLLSLAVTVVGIGRKRAPGSAAPTSPVVRDYLGFIVPVLVGQVLLNVLLQADLTMLRRFAADAAMASGLPLTAADPLVGAYRATQLFSFLPYQLLISVNFVLFPMLAHAARDGDKAAVGRYVATGVRIALVIAGLMVSVTAGLSRPLIRLVFGEQAAALGARSLELLALGFGAFAIFGVLTTVLNSLQRERASAAVTGLGAAAVCALCFLRVRGSPFGEDLLFRTASATSVGLVIATVGAAILVHRTAGAVVSGWTAARVVGAVALVVALGRMLPHGGAILTVLSAAALGLAYLIVLVVLRELGGKDVATLRRVLPGRSRA